MFFGSPRVGSASPLRELTIGTVRPTLTDPRTNPSMVLRSALSVRL